MSDHPDPADDVEGHMPFRRMFAEGTEEPADDVAGHKIRRAFTEDADEPADDVEGHMPFRRTFTEETDATDDVDGHAARIGRIADHPSPDDVERRLMRSGRDSTLDLARSGRIADDEADDVTGHLSGALGAQKRDEHL